jgi:predicted enzyme related to lactoylglutathione lyase
MATRKSSRKRAGSRTKKAARKGAKKAVKKKAARKTTKKRASARRAPRAAKAPAPAPPPSRNGVITHTELASADPAATRAWCENVLGWKFGESMPTPAGPYHMWQFAIGTGGGIRANNPPEAPGSVPYVEVNDIEAVYQKSLDAGATPMMPPEQISGGMGWIAIVAAPGGVAIGYWMASK